MRVLLAEDNPGDARLVEVLLGESRSFAFEVIWAKSLAETVEHLNAADFDAVLLDLGLPDCWGLDTLREVSKSGANSVIIVLTGANDEAMAIDAQQAGAHDYLVKGMFDGSHLTRAIHYAIERKRMERSLQRTVKELESFVFSISHDLKEPLRALNSYSQLLATEYGESLEGAGRDYVASISDASLRMKNLVEDLLALSRVGNEDVEVGPLDFNSVANDVIQSLNFRISERNAVVEVAETLPTVLADRTRLAQILGNLITNGLKFNVSATPIIKIGTHKTSKLEAVIYVQDNGLGIASQHQERIFGLFQRLDRRGAYEGTGAGLAIVKRAVESLGGSIWLDSAEGKGTTVFFSLPLAPQMAPVASFG